MSTYYRSLTAEGQKELLDKIDQVNKEESLKEKYARWTGQQDKLREIVSLLKDTKAFADDIFEEIHTKDKTGCFNTVKDYNKLITKLYEVNRMLYRTMYHD